VEVTAKGARFTVNLDIEPDDDNPSATLSAQDAFGDEVARIKVPPSFKLNRASAVAWVESGFERV
jgi:hypothetical protein